VSISRSTVVASRLLLLGLAAAALVVSIVIARAGHDDDVAGARYVCPMHPEVRAAAPGQCPICQMALEPVARGPEARPAMGGMADVTAVENVRKHKILEFVRVHTLLPHLRDLRAPATVDDDGAITAIYYNDEIAVLAADQVGVFAPSGAPGATVTVSRTPESVVPWDRSTSKVRFRPVRAGQAQPGQVGWLQVERKPREVLGVPASAIVQSPEGPYVLASLGGGRFEKRQIELGETFLKAGFAVVLSGLKLHDLVVSRATFFLEADRRLGDSVTGEAGMAVP
jgi:hypothetical protein